MRAEYVEEKMFLGWLDSNSLVGPLGKKGPKGLTVSTKFVLEEYPGDMLLTEKILRRVLNDYKILPTGQMH